MRELRSKLTSKGQVTLPAAVRKHLGVGPKDTVVFVMRDDGTVEVRPAKYQTIESICGIAGTLPRPMEWKEMIAIAREDALLAKYGPTNE